MIYSEIIHNFKEKYNGALDFLVGTKTALIYRKFADDCEDHCLKNHGFSAKQVLKWPYIVRCTNLEE